MYFSQQTLVNIPNKTWQLLYVDMEDWSQLLCKQNMLALALRPPSISESVFACGELATLPNSGKKSARCFSDQHEQLEQPICHGVTCVNNQSENIFNHLHSFSGKHFLLLFNPLGHRELFYSDLIQQKLKLFTGFIRDNTLSLVWKLNEHGDSWEQKIRSQCTALKLFMCPERVTIHELI